MNRQALIQKLKEDIAQGRVVIIAGTGVSIAACGNQLIENHPVASWPGLLQNGLEYCLSLGVADQEDAELLGNQIKSNNRRAAASQRRPNQCVSFGDPVGEAVPMGAGASEIGVAGLIGGGVDEVAK